MAVCFLSAETENGAIERGINHLDEDDRRFDERIAKNRTVETASWSQGNDTIALEEVISAFTVEYPISTKNLPSLVTVVDSHFENASKKYVDDQIFASKRIEDLEQAEEALAKRLDHEDIRGMNDSTIEKSKDDWPTVISMEKEEDVTEEARYSEQRNVQDIRAISFQVPPPDEKEEDYQDSWQQGKTSVGHMDETRKVGETKKNQSRPANNLLLSGKSTKAFYEIKPSIRTLEMERGRDHQFQMTTHRTLSDRKFVLPSVDSAIGKFGPYFEDGDREINVTARIGSTVLLDCKIGMLGDKKVSCSILH